MKKQNITVLCCDSEYVVVFQEQTAGEESVTSVISDNKVWLL